MGAVECCCYSTVTIVCVSVSLSAVIKALTVHQHGSCGLFRPFCLASHLWACSSNTRPAGVPNGTERLQTCTAPKRHRKGYIRIRAFQSNTKMWTTFQKQSILNYETEPDSTVKVLDSNTSS